METDKQSEPSLSSVSHNFKTPLTGIQMMLHLLAEQKAGPLNEKQQSMVNYALADCDRLVKTVQDHFAKEEDSD